MALVTTSWKLHSSLLLLPLLLGVDADEFCGREHQVRVIKEFAALSSDEKQLRIFGGSKYYEAVYPEAAFRRQTDNSFIICPCKIGRCVVQCPDETYLVDKETYGSGESVTFSDFQILKYGSKVAPHYTLLYNNVSELENIPPFPTIFNLTTADVAKKICFAVPENYSEFVKNMETLAVILEIYSWLWIPWMINAFFLTVLVLALYKAGDTKTTYGKCLIIHAVCMMLAYVASCLGTYLFHLVASHFSTWPPFISGLVLHYCEMCRLFWLTCLLHGMCATFSSPKRIESNDPRRFKIYSLISWYGPLVLTILLAVIYYRAIATHCQNEGCDDNVDLFIMLMRKVTRESLILFMLPETLSAFLNSYFFFNAAINIYNAQMELQNILKTKTINQVRFESFCVFMKLFCLMGVTRFVGVICWLFFIYREDIETFFAVQEVLGSMRGLGLLIFCIITKDSVRKVVHDCIIVHSKFVKWPKTSGKMAPNKNDD